MASSLKRHTRHLKTYKTNLMLKYYFLKFIKIPWVFYTYQYNNENYIHVQQIGSRVCELHVISYKKGDGNKHPRRFIKLKRTIKTYYSLSKTGYWLDVCHGWFHLYWLIRAVCHGKKRELQNEKLLPTAGFEPTTSGLLDWPFNLLR